MHTKTIAVASANPVKLNATLAGFHEMFPDAMFQVKGISVASGVRNQPLSNEETLKGALYRAATAMESCPEADFWVGIEGGVEDQLGDLSAFAWVVVLGPNRIGKSRTGTFFLPPRIAELVLAGEELGKADDLLFGRKNSKQENGAVGILTDDVIDRTALYQHAVILALIPFKNPDLYTSKR